MTIGIDQLYLLDEIALQRNYLTVSGGHNLAYVVHGNPNGIPIVFMHGGPGAGCTQYTRSLADPEQYFVVLYDQRGAGHSLPYACIAENDTQLLVEDQRRLLDHLQIDRAVFLGGSWGATLGLAYAIKYPETVSGLILRGIWLGTREENQHMYAGGTRAIFPEAFTRYLECVPSAWRADPLRYYYAVLQSIEEEHASLRRTLAYELTRYEMAMTRLIPLSEEDLHEKAMGSGFGAIAALEAHYIVNDCFLTDNYILRNVGAIPDVPIRIINGRYDAMCPPVHAYRLYHALREAFPQGRRDMRLDLVVAGHESSEPEIMKALLSATRELSELLR